MKSAFDQGEIVHIWKGTIEMEKWFDPVFQRFVDNPLFQFEWQSIYIDHYNMQFDRLVEFRRRCRKLSSNAKRKDRNSQ